MELRLACRRPRIEQLFRTRSCVEQAHARARQRRVETARGPQKVRGLGHEDSQSFGGERRVRPWSNGQAHVCAAPRQPLVLPHARLEQQVVPPGLHQYRTLVGVEGVVVVLVVPERVGRLGMRPPVLEEADSRPPSRLVALHEWCGRAGHADVLAVASTVEDAESGSRVAVRRRRPAERRRQRQHPVGGPHDVVGVRRGDLEHCREQISLRFWRERELYVTEIGAAERGESSRVERLLTQPRHRVATVVGLGPERTIELPARARSATAALDHDLESFVGEGAGDQPEDRVDVRTDCA